MEQACCAYGGGDKFGTPSPTVTPSLKPSQCVDEPEFVCFQTDAHNYTCKDISESFCHDYANAWSEQLSKNTKLACFTCGGGRHTAAVGSNTPSISPTQCVNEADWRTDDPNSIWSNWTCREIEENLNSPNYQMKMMGMYVEYAV